MPAFALSRRMRPALFAGPVFAIFLSANLVNLGNLGFNVLFSRWMGPALFGQLATLLTLFLAVMGVLGALQLAISQRIAADPDQGEALLAKLARLSQRGLVIGFAALPVLIGGTLAVNLGPGLGLDRPLLPLLLLCLPFALPLALARGVVTGRLDAHRVIVSAQVEMWVRLIGSALTWQAGLGLPGVTATIALSVLAGWLPLRTAVGPTGITEATVPTAATAGLFLAALPFAVLQAGQIILMDGDVILAQRLLGSEEAGYVAALGLFQRIQFFGCFSLAAILLPVVAAEVSAGRNPFKAARPVFALYAAVTALLIGLACVAPGPVLTLLVGPAFLPAAPYLPLISAAAGAFTLSYLLATYLAALGDRSGIWAIALACPVQIIVLALLSDSLGTLIGAKLLCQLVLVASLLFRAARRSLSTPTPSPQPLNA
jgi:O-antigen/teichoic acid export membrane protein